MTDTQFRSAWERRRKLQRLIVSRVAFGYLTRAQVASDIRTYAMPDVTDYEINREFDWLIEDFAIAKSRGADTYYTPAIGPVRFDC